MSQMNGITNTSDGTDIMLSIGLNAVNSKLFNISKPRAVIGYSIGLHIGRITSDILLRFVLAEPLASISEKYHIPVQLLVDPLIFASFIGIYQSGKLAAKCWSDTDVTFGDAVKLSAVCHIEAVALLAIAVAIGGDVSSIYAGKF